MIGIQIDSTTGDLALPEGRMTLGEVREQTAQFLLEGVPGSFGEYPSLGLAVRRQLGAPHDPMFPTLAVKMMRHCLIPVERIVATSDGYGITFKD